MGINGDCWVEGSSIVSDLGRFWPICCGCVEYEFLCLQVLSVWRAFGGYVTARGKGLGVDFVPHLVPNRDLLPFSRRQLWSILTTRCCSWNATAFGHYF